MTNIVLIGLALAISAVVMNLWSMGIRGIPMPACVKTVNDVFHDSSQTSRPVFVVVFFFATWLI